MPNGDDLTKVGMEIVIKGVQLSAELILKIFEAIEKLFEKNSENQNHIIKDNTKEGKQKIKNLVRKHKEGVLAFDDNVTKEQMKDYVSEFKKMGVDFSVVKNEKDSFSFFFAARDANVIEKALKNIVEKKNNILESNKEKDIEKEPAMNSNDKADPTIEPNDKTTPTMDSNDKTDPTIEANNKPTPTMDSNDKTDPTIEANNKPTPAMDSNEKIDPAMDSNDKTKPTIDPNNKTESTIDPDDKTKPTIDPNDKTKSTIEPNDKTTPAMDSNDKANPTIEPHDKTTSTIDSNDTIKFDSKEEQLDHIYKQLTPEETKLFKQLNQAQMESIDNASSNKNNHFESDKYDNFAKQFSPESQSKVNELYVKNMTSQKVNPPNGKIQIDELSKIETNLKKEKQIQPQDKTAKPQEQKAKQDKIDKPKDKAAKPQEYSLRAVKEIDKKLKEKDNKNPDKKRSKELSR